MPATALALALGAAFLHAFWNLLLARAPDIEATTAVALVVGHRRVRTRGGARVGGGGRGLALPRRHVTPPAGLLRAPHGRVRPGGAVVRLPDRARLGAGDRPARRTRSCSARSRRPPRSPACCWSLRASSSCAVFAVRARWRPRARACDRRAASPPTRLLDQRGIEYASPVVYQELSMIPATLALPAADARRRGRDCRPRGGRRSRRRGRPRARSARTSSSWPRSRARPRRRSQPCARRASSSRRALAVPLLHERVGPGSNRRSGARRPRRRPAQRSSPSRSRGPRPSAGTGSAA